MSDQPEKKRDWIGTDNLAPLMPDVYGTGRWGYKGQNLTPEDVERLTAKGVDWQRDLMPDGRLKHPKYRLRRIANRRNSIAKAQVRLADGSEGRWKEYEALPDPKPDFCEWAAQRDRRMHFESLERVAMNATRDSDRVKALATIFEFTKTKPKQTVENINKVEDAQDVPMEKLLEMIVLHMGPEAVGKVMERFKPQ